MIADLEEYLLNGDQLRVIATTLAFLEKDRAAVVGGLESTIGARRFMQTRGNHTQMMGIRIHVDLEFEKHMDQRVCAEEYPLIPAMPSDGSVNAPGPQVRRDEENSAGRVSQ